MILIITVHSDWSSNDVIEWLKYVNADYIRLNFEDLHALNIQNIISNEKIELIVSTGESNEVLFKASDLDTVWYRRSSGINLNINLNKIQNESRRSIGNFMINEMKYFNESFFGHLNDKRWLNHFGSITNDKLKTLFLAKELGIDVPTTIITNSKQTLLKFNTNFNKIIVKPIYNMEPLTIDKVSFLQYTTVFEEKMLKNHSERLFPTLAQEFLEKTYEIRSFFLDGKFYSMAIFSQNDVKTALDFRQYNRANPNRTVPYELPVEIEDKLRKLMIEMNLNSGSIDIVKTKSGRWVFLEVNPVGQFGMISYPCNYFVEKKIADFLNKNEKYEKEIN
jgi:ATP-GRASP peptide maturase of grasp-with-spasm system